MPSMGQSDLLPLGYLVWFFGVFLHSLFQPNFFNCKNQGKKSQACLSCCGDAYPCNRFLGECPTAERFHRLVGSLLSYLHK